MHPVIRVSLFLVFAVSISRGDVLHLAPAILVLFLFFIMRARLRWGQAIQMLKRLRWFFITILLLYGWLTPGQSLIVFGTSLSILGGPTIEGLLAGLIQIASLVLMILALVALITNQPKEVLLGAIYWWGYPLKYLRLSRELVVLRLVLTMETVELLQKQISAYDKQSSLTSRWQRLVGMTEFAFKQVCKQAEQEPPGQVSIHCLAAPPLWQWSYPIVVAVLFQASHFLYLMT